MLRGQKQVLLDTNLLIYFYYYKSGFFKIIRPLPQTFGVFLKLISGKNVKKGKIFDFYLAAAALSNNIKTVCTENEKDFKNIEGLKIINPFK